MNLKENDTMLKGEYTKASYTDKGLVYDTDFKVTKEGQLTEYQSNLTNRIDSLTRTLSMMIMIPSYETDPDTFKKEFRGSIQTPILEGEQRESALKVLSELINQL